MRRNTEEHPPVVSRPRCCCSASRSTRTPATLDDLLTARGVALLARPSAPLAAALRTTDAVCRGWAPGVPVRLFQIVKDEQAANTDAARCVAELRAGGTGPSLITFRKGRYHGSAHLSSNVQGTAATVRWFAGT
jgi:hypothetical protein